MILQQRYNKTIGKKDYFKYQITIPPEIVASIGWKPGDKLSCQTESKSLVIRRLNIK